MTYHFDIDKIVNYLNRYKEDLPNLYTWNANISKIVGYGVLSEDERMKLDSLLPFDKEIVLKNRINQRLHEAYKTDIGFFHKLCLWVIKDWGGITTSKDDDTIQLVMDFLNTDSHPFKRIASASKVGSYMYPEKYIIYDSRVAYSLNWVLLAEGAGESFFPIPDGRNSKMMALDMNVLIRLFNIENYQPDDIKKLDNRLYIKNKDKGLYIPESESYQILNELIKEVNQKLWDSDKADKLYYTEMLLFSIADREVFKDVTSRIKIKIG